MTTQWTKGATMKRWLAVGMLMAVVWPSWLAAAQEAPPSAPPWVPVQAPCDTEARPREELIDLGEHPDERLLYAQQGPTSDETDYVEIAFPTSQALNAAEISSIDQFFERYVNCLNQDEAATYSLMTDGFAGAFIRAEADDFPTIASYVDSLLGLEPTPSESPGVFDAATVAYLPYSGWRLPDDQVGVVVGLTIYYPGFEDHPSAALPPIEDTLAVYVVLNRDGNEGDWVWADLTGPIDPVLIPIPTR